MTAEFAASPAAVLLGRERERSDLDERLLSQRLVTVIGPGGVGKTALAHWTARVVAERFASSVGHVDLTRVEAPAAVPGTVAAQLGFASLDDLLAAPGDHRRLVVVDNCEHVLHAAASAIAELLEAHGGSSVLATSRSPLELPGESVLALAPLTVPTELDNDPYANPAVRLFLDRARNAGAIIGDAEWEAVIALCRRLDGLPLAIEIAAARARTMSVAEIASRLGEGLDVLKRPRFRGPPRHRDIADTIGWSYALLPPGAAALLDQLAVFAGPFTAVDARHVAPPETLGMGHNAFDDHFDELVNLSLVVADTSGPETRFRLLDTVRRFALDQLDRRDGRQDAFDRLADHAVTLAREAFVMGSTSWDGLLRHLVESFDTLTEALRWCLDRDDEPVRAMRLCAVLWPVGRYNDTIDLARGVFERWPGSELPIAADATVTLVYGECISGNASLAVELAEAQLARLSAPSFSGVTLRRALGHSRIMVGDMAGALTAFRDGARAARQLGLVEAALDLTVSEAEVHAFLGEVERALVLLDEVRREAQAVDSRLNAATAATCEAWVLVNRDGASASAAVQQALDLAREIEHRGAISVNLRSMVCVHLLRDDLAAAACALREWFDSVVAWGGTSDASNLVGTAAVVAHRAGHPSWEALAATHRQMPLQLLPSDVGGALFPLPDVDAAPIVPRERLRAVTSSIAGVEELIALGSTEGQAEPADVTTGGTDAASMRSMGDVWEVRFEGRSVTMRSSKGVDTIARILEADGRETHCLDLMGAVVEESSTGDVIDAAARRRYEDRIRELQATIDEAEAANDFVRGELAQVELDRLVEHLAAALGHRGRTRRTSNSAERARSAVTQRVRTTIRQIDALHPALGRHLGASIKTGLYCSYQPEHRTCWTIVRG